MRTETTRDVPPAAIAAFITAIGLAATAPHNEAVGVYGGAIVSSTDATLLGLLT